jgi:hypothetical protein
LIKHLLEVFINAIVIDNRLFSVTFQNFPEILDGEFGILCFFRPDSRNLTTRISGKLGIFDVVENHQNHSAIL